MRKPGDRLCGHDVVFNEAIMDVETTVKGGEGSLIDRTLLLLLLLLVLLLVLV